MSIRSTETEAARRISEKSKGTLEYVSGYYNKESKVVVRCVECGKEFERTYHHLTTHPNECVYCRSERIATRNAKRKQEASVERFRRQTRAKANKANRAKQICFVFCEICGSVTYRPKYCSNKCAQKVSAAQKEAKRRIKIKDAFVDRGINVKTLFRRDNGVCHICGERCNFEDYVIRDDVFIAGDWYPSIDHVVPLCKGGTHSWDNVKLAHRRCNSIKGGNG